MDDKGIYFEKVINYKSTASGQRTITVTITGEYFITVTDNTVINIDKGLYIKGNNHIIKNNNIFLT